MRRTTTVPGVIAVSLAITVNFPGGNHVAYGSTGAPLLLAAMALGGTPAQVGEWLPPVDWEVIGIHAATLPTGEVLHWSRPNGTVGSQARLWDPATGQFTEVDMSTDIFCSGLSMLANGSVFVSGGNDYDCDFQGRQVTHTFDPFTRTWTQVGLMTTGRWYPTNLALGDGTVMILSGLDQACTLTDIMERFTPGVGLQLVPQGARFLPLYPRAHLLTSGKIAHVGPDAFTNTFDPQAGLWEIVAETGSRHEGSSVLLPGRTDQIMIFGGENPLTNTAEIIDFSSAKPTWHRSA